MLKRKSFLAISSLVLVSVLIGSLFYYNMVQAQGVKEYSPWCDINDDGKIDHKDLLQLAAVYGTSGTSISKAAIAYDSGWENITDKAGQYFNVTHNLNSTDVIVDITGKTTIDGGVHQRHLGGTGYILGWWRTYGGTNDDRSYSMVQTSDGGYAIAGYTKSFGAGSYDFWIVKTEVESGLAWTDSTADTITLYRGGNRLLLELRPRPHLEDQRNPITSTFLYTLFFLYQTNSLIILKTYFINSHHNVET